MKLGDSHNDDTAAALTTLVIELVLAFLLAIVLGGLILLLDWFLPKGF